jgi:hypothetical protein
VGGEFIASVSRLAGVAVAVHARPKDSISIDDQEEGMPKVQTHGMLQP